MNITVLSLLADGLLPVIAVVCTIAVLMTKEWWIRVPVVLMAGLTSVLVGKLMSLVYQPEIARPFIALGQAPGAAYIDNPGFPSDHMLLATAGILATIYITKSWRLALVLGAIVIVMGSARVVALVHTPEDIFGGIAASLIGAIWYGRENSRSKSNVR